MDDISGSENSAVAAVFAVASLAIVFGGLALLVLVALAQ